MFPYRRAAMTRLRALRAGRSKAIVGVGDVKGHPYVAIGTLAVPLTYVGPEKPDVSDKLASLLSNVASEEIFVTYIPCITGHKNRGTWEENVHTSREGMIDPVLLAMAVYAVGDMPRLYQGPSHLDSIAVIGTLGTAVLAAMRKPEDMPAPPPPKEKPASRAKRERAAEAPRAEAPRPAPRAEAPRPAPVSTEPGIEIEGKVDLYSVYPASEMLDRLAASYRGGTAPELTNWDNRATKKEDAPGPKTNLALYFDSYDHLRREGLMRDGKPHGKGVHYVGTRSLLIPGFYPPDDFRWDSTVGPAGQHPWTGYDSGPTIRNAFDYGYLKDMRELTVREIPAPAGWGKKTAKTKERMIFFPVLGNKYGFSARNLGIAVRAVGPNVRLFQIHNRAHTPLFVHGDNGTALVMPQTPDEEKAALIKRLEVEAAAKASSPAAESAPRPAAQPRTPRAPRPSRASAAQVDPDKVWDGHDRVDPYLRLQRYAVNIQPTLNRYLGGKDKNLVGWGEYEGYYYISDGHAAFPGYRGSLPEEGGREEAPNKQKQWKGHIHSMAEVVGRAASPEDARELTVTQIPLPTLWDNKQYSEQARAVLISEWSEKVGIDPKLFGMAVLAVGPNVRLFQSRSSEFGPVAVKGDKGIAVVMPRHIG